MKNSNISGTTDNSDFTISDTTSDDIPDDVSESIIPGEDDENVVETRLTSLPQQDNLENFQRNELTATTTAPVNTQPEGSTENNKIVNQIVDHPTLGDESNVKIQIHPTIQTFCSSDLSSVHSSCCGSNSNSSNSNSNARLSSLQITAAIGVRLQPHQVPTFVKLYGIYEKSYKQ